MDFSRFDSRHYPTLPVEPGYDEWAASYEDTVVDLMDLRLLEALRSVDWPRVRQAADLGCGTGRAGAWLKGRGVGAIDGVDLSGAMLQRAERKGAYRRLAQRDLAASGLADGAYDLVISMLVDEHLPSLRPLYIEAARLLKSSGRFVIVGYHSHFLMLGIPAHFDRASGESVAIESYVHLMSDHVAAAHAAGLKLTDMREGLVDQAWISAKPRWAVYAGRPVSFAMVWGVMDETRHSTRARAS